MPVENRLKELLIKKMADENRIITEADLARAFKMSRQTVNNWMHNQITTFKSETIDIICRYFECEVGALLVRVEDKEDQSTELQAQQ